MLTNLMFFTILIARFMFGVRVCFCDFETNYNTYLSVMKIDVNTISPSPTTGFSTCLKEDGVIIKYYLWIHGCIYGLGILIYFVIWIKKNCFQEEEMPIETKLRFVASTLIDTYAFKRVTKEDALKTFRKVSVYTS